jgi:hypothetical protein
VLLNTRCVGGHPPPADHHRCCLARSRAPQWRAHLAGAPLGDHVAVLPDGTRLLRVGQGGTGVCGGGQGERQASAGLGSGITLLARSRAHPCLGVRPKSGAAAECKCALCPPSTPPRGPVRAAPVLSNVSWCSSLAWGQGKSRGGACSEWAGAQAVLRGVLPPHVPQGRGEPAQAPPGGMKIYHHLPIGRGRTILPAAASAAARGCGRGGLSASKRARQRVWHGVEGKGAVLWRALGLEGEAPTSWPARRS